MIYYGLPTKWALAIENIIVGKVRECLISQLDLRPSC